MKSGFVKQILCGLGLGMLANVALAEAGEAFRDGVNYLPIKPALVVNYGGPGKVKYIKAEISLRVEDAERAEEVTHHMPLVRDTLIMLISSVTDEQMASGEGKEKMRRDALARLNEVLEAAEHPDAKKAEKAKLAAKNKADEKAKKSKKAKDEAEASSENPEEKPKGPPVSDLLFDNLVVQK